MPLGNHEVKSQVSSLRSLTTTATITHFFDKDPDLLGKVYKHGILPVRVINDIYCPLARSALEKSKAEIKPSYEAWAQAWREMNIARYDLTAQQFKYYKNEPLEEHLRYMWTRKKAISQANFEAFNKVRYSNYERLQDIDAIFGALERDAIMDAAQDWEMQKIRREIDDHISQSLELSKGAKLLAEANPNSLVN